VGASAPVGPKIARLVKVCAGEVTAAPAQNANMSHADLSKFMLLMRTRSDRKVGAGSSVESSFVMGDPFVGAKTSESCRIQFEPAHVPARNDRWGEDDPRTAARIMPPEGAGRQSGIEVGG